jgi:CspA family cold shock protein
MAIGTVKFFDAVKGFGFIIPEGGGKDIFVHKRALELAGITTLSQGQYVSFETEANARGAVAAAQLKQHSNESVPATAYESAVASAISENNSERKITRNIGRKPPFTTFSKAPNTAQSSSIQNPQSSNKFGEWRRDYERYCDLAQNADNDGVTREHYWQYAEHFLRMMNGSAT